MNDPKKEKVKKDDFKSSWSRNKEWGEGNGSKECYDFKKDQSEDVIDVDQEGGQGIQEKGENRGQEAEGDNEETYIRDDEEVGRQSNEGDPVEMKRDKGSGSQHRDSGDKER